MNTIKKIMVPVDFSPNANYAAGQAVAFAEKCGAEIDMVHVTLLHEYDPNNPRQDFPEIAKTEDRREVLDRPEAHVGERMDRTLEGRQHHGVQINKVQVRGIAETDALLDYLKENPADLVIMGTHGRRGFKRWLLGSVAEEMIRFAPCPVLTVKEGWRGSLGDIKKILVPIDFSLASKTALKNANQLAKLFGASLHLVHVIQKPAYPEVYGDIYPSPAAFFADAEDKARHIMESLQKEHHGAASVEIHVRKGHPSPEILSLAEEQEADLVLIAHLGLSRLPDKVMGSVAEHVVRGAKCPALTANMDQD